MYLGYWGTKHWKYLVFEKKVNADDINLVEQKYLMYSLFIAYENDEWCSFVVHISIESPLRIFLFSEFLCEVYYLLSYWGKFDNTENKSMELLLGSSVEIQGVGCYSFI